MEVRRQAAHEDRIGTTRRPPSSAPAEANRRRKESGDTRSGQASPDSLCGNVEHYDSSPPLHTTSRLPFSPLQVPKLPQVA